MTEPTVEPDDLAALLAGIGREHGIPPADSALLADTLVMAELWGHPSHGAIRLPWYLARIGTGAMAAVTEVETVRDAGPVVVLDGHDGLGQVVTQRAVEVGVDRALEHGVSAVAVRRSGHFGAAAYFTRYAAERGCIALLATNASPAMAPWGGRDRLVGTNPWSIAAPGPDGQVLVMDMANTAVARGKVHVAADRGTPIPAGWAARADGTPTTDPREAIEGLILPVGGAKGYVMAFMFDVLAGVLTGSAFGADVVGPFEPRGRSGAGHLLLTLDVAAFADPDDYDARVRSLVEQVRGSEAAGGSEGVLTPGELEDRHRARAEAHGIHLSDRTWAELSALADAVGVPMPRTRPTTEENP